jgi:hypothetical protein
MNIIIKAKNNNILAVNVQSETYHPCPGEDRDEIRTVLIQNIPEEVSIFDVMESWKSLPQEPAQLVWTWEQVLRRDHPGELLTLSEASEIAALAPYTLKMAIINRLLPGSRPKQPRGGVRPHAVNENDLQWYLENTRKKPGRPKAIS